MAYSGQRPAGMQEGCTGSQGPQRIGELEKEDYEEQEEEKRDKKKEETMKEKKTRKKGQ